MLRSHKAIQQVQTVTVRGHAISSDQLCKFLRSRSSVKRTRHGHRGTHHSTRHDPRSAHEVRLSPNHLDARNAESCKGISLLRRGTGVSSKALAARHALCDGGGVDGETSSPSLLIQYLPLLCLLQRVEVLRHHMNTLGSRRGRSRFVSHPETPRYWVVGYRGEDSSKTAAANVTCLASSLWTWVCSLARSSSRLTLDLSTGSSRSR